MFHILMIPNMRQRSIGSKLCILNVGGQNHNSIPETVEPGVVKQVGPLSYKLRDKGLEGKE